MNTLFDKTFDAIEFMLDYRSERQKILTSNVANMDSVNYKPRDLVFARQLEGASASGSAVPLKRTDPRHLPSGWMGLSENALKVVTTGQKVVLDDEMMNLSENQLQYNAGVEMLGRKFRILNNLLREV